MSDGDGGTHGGFWKTGLGYLVQIGAILGAIAGIIAGVAALTDGESSEDAAGLPAGCVSAVATGEATGGGGEPRELGSIEVAPRPAAIAIGGGAVWVAHTTGRVTRIPAGTSEGRVDPLPGVRVGVGARGQVSIAHGLGAVWVTRRVGAAGFLARIDPSGAKRPEIKFAGVDNVTTGGAFVWVTDDSGDLTRMDPSDLGDRRGESAGGDPHGVWAGHTPCVYVAISDADGFSAFDADSATRIGEPFGLGVPGGEIVVEAGALWMTESNGNRLLRVDPEEPNHADMVDVDIALEDDALAGGDSGIWTAGEDTVVRVDPSSLRPQPIPLGGAPVGLAVGGDPEVVWVARRDRGLVTRIQP